MRGRWSFALSLVLCCGCAGGGASSDGAGSDGDLGASSASANPPDLGSLDLASPVDAAAGDLAAAPTDAAAGDLAARPDIGAPRLIAPLSGASAPSTPRLRWALAAGSDGAQLRLCRDRALTDACVTFTASGTNGAPPGPLANGVWFWQAHGMAAGAVGAAASATWELRVGVAAGGALDFDGDGYADVVVSARDATQSYLYLYRGGASGLPATPSSTLAVPPTVSALASADVDGDGISDLIVGNSSADSDRGWVFVYLGRRSGALATADQWLANPDDKVTFFGAAVANAGDVNGDGYDDLVVGATYGKPARAYVFLGGPLGVQATPWATFVGDDPTGADEFGATVAGVGDVDGDGFADVVVGAPHWQTDLDWAGRARLYRGGASSMVGVDQYWQGDLLDGELGTSVAGADLNGDGFADVVLGLPGACGPTQQMVPPPPCGAIYVFFGGAGGPHFTPDLVLQNLPGGASGAPGYTVAAADVDGDGHVDVIQGDPENSWIGVYRGGAAGLETSPSEIAAPVDDTNVSSAIQFGAALSAAGDVNGDGFADVVVGAAGAVDGAGRAHAYLGAAAGLAGAPSNTWAPAAGESAFGACVVR